MARKNLLTEGEIHRFMKLANMNPVGDGRLKEMGMYPGARDEEEELESELGATEDELGAEDDVADEEADELDADAEMGGEDLSDELEDMLAQGVEALASAWGIEDRVDVEGGEEEEVAVEDEVEMDVEEPGGEEEVEMEMGAEEEVPMMETRARRRQRRLKEGTTKGEKTETGELAYKDPSKGEEDEPEKGREAKTPGYRPKAYGQKASVNEDSGEDEAWHEWKNEHADDDHIKEIEHHLRALKDDRDYERHGAEHDHDKYEDEGYNESKKRQDAIVKEVSRRVAARLGQQNQKEQMAEQMAERILKRLTK